MHPSGNMSSRGTSERDLSLSETLSMMLSDTYNSNQSLSLVLDVHDTWAVCVLAALAKVFSAEVPENNMDTGISTLTFVY